MADVTYIMILTSDLDDGEDAIAQLSRYLHRGDNLFLHNLTKERSEFSHIFPFVTLVGAYKSFNTNEFLEFVRKEVKWNDQEFVQIFIKEENEWNYSVYCNGGHTLVYNAIKQ